MASARVTASHRRFRPPTSSTGTRLRWLLLAAVVVFGVLVGGGYGLGWHWTGLSGSVKLWDWLEVLALPLAIGCAPVLMLRRRVLSPRHRTWLAAVLAAFVCLVIVGYAVPLSWTGFRGNTLWDWLELVLLPLVVATASLWPSVSQFERRHFTVVAVAAGVLAAFVAAGYLVPWTWTGFRGNTAWDWVKLLLLPLLIPTALLPLVKQRLQDRLAEREDASSQRRS